MLIKSFCVGNKEESFFIDSFKEGINIIHSDDNDKGKTIVTQGIMYCLGNTPCFPSGFDDYREYYFILEIQQDDATYTICRKKDYIFINKNGCDLLSFDSINEFKRYFSKEIMPLPVIQDNGRNTLVGLELFFELFFMPQDNRTTSNIFNKRRYNKEDYLNMVYAINSAIEDVSAIDVEELKHKLKILDSRKKVLVHSLKAFKSKNLETKYYAYTTMKDIFEEKIMQLDKLQKILNDLINKKNRLLSKKTKNEMILKEINNLYRDIDSPHLTCLTCGSSKIAYETSEPRIKFDVTDIETRNSIKKILSERIEILNEDIRDLDEDIIHYRRKLNELSKDEVLSIENYLFYKKDILSIQKIDDEIILIDKDIAKIKDELYRATSIEQVRHVTKRAVFDTLVQKMRLFYKEINPADPLIINTPFTKANLNYSGSQGIVYIMSRYVAIAQMTDYKFPIIIDDFRDGEISTQKEYLIIEELQKLDRQVILTCTLKDEESNKYLGLNLINDISFDEIEKFHLLSSKDNEVFRKQLLKLNINLNIQN